MSTTPNSAPESHGWRLHAVCLLLIAAAVLLPRVVGATLAVAPARDVLRFVRAAETIDRCSLLDAVRAIDCHPLYPATLLGAKRVWTAATGSDGPSAWFRAGQILSVLCYLIFLFGAYAAGCRLWNPRIACLGCVALSVVPRQVNYSIDVLSDSLHAAFWIACFAFLVIGWRRPRWPWFAGAGLMAFLAYLTRPEALLLPLVFLSALAATQLLPSWRWPWRTAAAAALTFGLAYVPLAGGYYATISRLSPRNSASALLGNVTQAEPTVPTDQRHTQIGGEPLPVTNPSLAARDGAKTNLITRPWERDENYEYLDLWPSFVRLGQEIGQETRVWMLPLLIGLLLPVARARMTWPAGLLVVFAWLGGAAMMLLLQMKAGYMAGRYLTPLLPFLAMAAMAGGEALLRCVVALPTLPWERRLPRHRLPLLRQATVVGGMAALALILCVPPLLKPLHRFRRPHLEAAAWPRDHTGSGEPVFDPLDLTSFFAGRPNWKPSRLDEPVAARYAVIDAARIYRTDQWTHRAIADVNARGRVVARFQLRDDGRETRVFVFELVPPAARVEPREPPQ